MTQTSLVSPHDQGATFVELFFDLVFVFAITQVTHFAAHHLDPPGLLRSLIVFWLIWWAWTQFTWALNSADTDHHQVRLGTLVSTGAAFVMAVSVEKAFSTGATEALWFSISYVTVRLLGLGLYRTVAAANVDHRSAVDRFAALSTLGLAAVLAGGFLDPTLRAAAWSAAILLDLAAAWIAGNRGEWGLQAGHFAERHGLIVIIALGESLIVAASALTSAVPPSLMITGAAAVVATCLLWWSYFGWVRDVLEQELLDRKGQERSRLGRDAFTLWHFPLVSGVVALAVGFEASFHPGDYSLAQVTVAVAAGLTLFLVSTAGALWRATRCVLWNRLIVLALSLGALSLGAASSANQVLGIGCAALALIIGVEQLTVRRRLDPS